MERTKKISTQTLAIAILSLLLVASLVMTATGAWFTSGDSLDSSTYTFGTINLADTAATYGVSMDEASTDVIMPGDHFDVAFTVTNAGTADMWVRFKLTITDAQGAITLDPDGAGPEPAAASLNALLVDQLTGWTLGVDGYIYRDAVLVGNTADYITAHPLETNGTEDLAVLFEIPNSISFNTAATISLALVVDAVQVANNSATNGPDVLGYPTHA